MSKWNKWKLIHRETGMTFNQYRQKFKIKMKDGTINDMSHPKEKYMWYEPVLLQGGYPAVYNQNFSYYENASGLYFLDAKDWKIEMRPSNV